MRIIENLSFNDRENLKVVFDEIITDYIDAIAGNISDYDLEGLELLDLDYEDIYDDETGEYLGTGLNTIYGKFIVTNDNEEEIERIFENSKRYVLSNI